VSSATYTPLLPANQSAVEGALVQATDTPAATDAAVREVPTLYRPDALRAAWLPWLAWAWDALYWSDQATEETRRKILRQSWHTHRIAGTLASYKRVARYAGFRVVDAIRPPDKTFLGAAMTRAERNAWVRQFPQLRIYPYRSRGSAAGSHPSRCYLGQTSGSACWPAIGDAAARIGERAYLYRDGAETPLTTATVERETEAAVSVRSTEAKLKGKAGDATWLGQFARYTADVGASRRLYTVGVETPYMDRTAELRLRTATPTLRPLSLQYDSVAGRQTVRRDAGVFLSCRRAIGPDVDACFARTGGKACGFAAGYIASQDAGRRVYRRLYLLLPDAATPSRGRSTHLDATRLGMPPYHATLRLDLTRRVSDRTAFCRRFVGAHTSDVNAGARIRHARRALAPLRSARDRIWLDTTLRSPLRASQQHRVSPALIAGQYVSEAH